MLFLCSLSCEDVQKQMPHFIRISTGYKEVNESHSYLRFYRDISIKSKPKPNLTRSHPNLSIPTPCSRITDETLYSYI